MYFENTVFLKSYRKQTCSLNNCGVSGRLQLVTVCYSSLPALSSTVVFSLVGVTLTIRRVLDLLKAAEEVPSTKSGRTGCSWTFPVGLAGDISPCIWKWKGHQKHDSIPQLWKAPSSWFIDAIFQPDWNAYLARVPARCLLGLLSRWFAVGVMKSFASNNEWGSW